MMKTRLLICTAILVIFSIGCSKDDSPKVPDPINKPDPKPVPENEPPGAFTLQTVLNNGVDVDPKPTLTWSAATDPDGDKVTYSLYLDKGANPESIVAEGVTATTFTVPDDMALPLAKEYYWKVIAKDGKGGETVSTVLKFTVRKLKNAQQLTTTNPFTARDRHESVVFDNKMWVIGGFTFEASNDVWSSIEGTNWVQPTIPLDQIFTKRFFYESLVFDNKIWVIAGNGDSGFLNDVWSSGNGTSWTEVPQTNAFPIRGEHSAIVYNDKLWVIGGSTTGAVKLNDVWSSTDGADWTLVKQNAAFSPRNFHQSVSFNDKLWVIAGLDDLNPLNDIWSSEDGSTWTEVTPTAAFSKRYGHRVLTFDNKLWVIGSATTNDIWYSEDGVNWTDVTPATSFPVVQDFTAVYFDHKIWILGGSNSNIVWYFDLN